MTRASIDLWACLWIINKQKEKMALPTSYNLFRHTEIAKNYRNFVSTFSEWKSYMLLTGNESEDEKILSTFINTIAHEEGHAVVMVVGCAMRELNGYDGLFLIRCLQVSNYYYT